MINNDTEFQATQERITFFVNQISQMRKTASESDYFHMSAAWLAELEKMQSDVIQYLRIHPSAVELVGTPR